MFSQSTRLLGLFRNITFNFSSIESMLRLYIALVRSKLEYASVVRNSITWTDASKLERIQQRFAALCFYRFFPQVRYSYTLALQESNLHTLRMRRHRLDTVFLIQVYSGSKFCPSVLETVGLWVPPRRIRDFALFGVCYSCKNCPSARYASAANAICSDDHVFGSRNILLRRLLQDSWLYIIVLLLLLLHVYFSHSHLYVSNIIIIIIITFCTTIITPLPT
jgi:hypothetical protein